MRNEGEGENSFHLSPADIWHRRTRLVDGIRSILDYPPMTLQSDNRGTQTVDDNDVDNARSVMTLVSDRASCHFSGLEITPRII